MTAAAPISHISDTARWVAVYRAMESERPDAIFRDPYARRLAGPRGEAIVRAMPKGAQMAWPMIVRTAVMDEILMRVISADRIDCVLNLAAGLDARPWRLSLPSLLKWVDVDHPEMIDYKLGAMVEEKPVCHYEAVRLDLADRPARSALFGRLGAASSRVLVITEGLLVYLKPEAVAEQLAGLEEMPKLLSSLHAAEHSLIALLPLWAMCDRWDIGGLSTNLHFQTGRATIFVYDGHSGGVGIADRGFDVFEGWAEDTAKLLRGCPCERGCPSCVQSPKCGNLNEPLDKAGALTLLDRMLASA